MKKEREKEEHYLVEDIRRNSRRNGTTPRESYGWDRLEAVEESKFGAELLKAGLSNWLRACRPGKVCRERKPR